MRKIVTPAVLLLGLVAADVRIAAAASQAILGKKLLIVAPADSPHGRRILAQAKEKSSPNTVVGDPTVGGATLRVIANGGTDTDETYTLPAAGWSPVSGGFKFSNTTTGGPVKSALISKTGSGIFRVRISVRDTGGTVNNVPPNPGTDGGIVLTLGGGDSYCVAFGGAAGGKIGANTAKAFRVLNPTAEGCPDQQSCPPVTARAKVITNPADFIDGPLSRSQLGDVLMANDMVQVVIQKPGRVMFGIGTYGGNIIDGDLQRCNVAENDNFEEITPLINLENTANYTNVTVLNDGLNGQPAVVRATGPDDLIDFINASTVVRNFGFTFPASADDRDLPIDVQTDYVLEQGKPYVRIETTLTNLDPNPTGLTIFFGDIMNGSGKVEEFEPAYGFGQPLVTSTCNAGTYQPCATGTCDVCDMIAYRGVKSGQGVSYGYIHTVNGSSNFNTAGVAAIQLGQETVLVLIGGQGPNPMFHMGPAGLPGDAITVTRYFAIGDGTVAAIADIRNDILGLSTTGTISGTVTVGGSPLANVDVAVLSNTPNPGGPARNVANNVQTAADGTYSGTLPAGSYTVRVNKEVYLFGSPDPANVTIVAATPTVQDFALTAAGTLHVTVTDELGQPSPAKVQLVGLDPSADPLNTQSIFGVVNNTTGVFGDVGQDGLDYGIMSVAFADKNGDAGNVDVEPGSYQLVVSRGPRYSAFVQPVTITAGATTTVAAQVARVVQTPGFIAGDFHVHSFDSPDASVTRTERVATMLAEGMDFFTPSDHDFRADFQPTLNAMGVTSLISTAPSAEITTFDYGHFNSWPVTVDPSAVNGGGVDFGRAGIAPGMDFPSLGSYSLSPAEIFATAHADPKANLVQINHVASFFGRDGLDIDTAEGGLGPPQSHTAPLTRRLDPAVPNFFDTGFDALEVWIGTDGRSGDLNTFLGLNLGDWVNLLNQGIRRSGVSDSDTHSRRSTKLGTRNWVASGVTDPGLLGPEAENLAGQVISGHSFGSNSEFITISAVAASTSQTAGIGLGESTQLSTSDGSVDVTVSVKSPLWAEFDKIQFLVNARPQAYDHDGNANTRKRYRALPNDVCSIASGCYEKVAGTDFTETLIDDYPSISGAKHWEATTTLNLTGLTADSWVIVLVRGTDGVSHPLFPVNPASIRRTSNTTLANLTDGNLGEDGVLALGFTNPIYIDANNDNVWTPPGVLLTP